MTGVLHQMFGPRYTRISAMFNDGPSATGRWLAQARGPRIPRGQNSFRSLIGSDPSDNLVAQAFLHQVISMQDQCPELW
jgi:hypothetical protein